MTLSRVTVMDVRIDRRTESPVVILRDSESSGLFLPIWVGDMEAISIQMALEKRKLSRPLTHDLLVNLLEVLGVETLMLRINRVENQTYYAGMVIEQDGREIDIDCRPSDGIAVALPKNGTLYVGDKLLYATHFAEDVEENGHGDVF